MRKLAVILICLLPLKVMAMLSAAPRREAQWTSETPGQLLSDREKEVDSSALLGGYSAERIEMNQYVFDYSIVDSLDLNLVGEVGTVELLPGQYSYAPNVGSVQASLNTTLASIYARYLEKSLMPLKDPLWLIAVGSVEYNYSTNDSGVIFSFPVDVEAAAANPNYLLEYGWKEVQRIGGNSAVLRRDGSSIGILQLTKGYGVSVDPVVPEEFGVIGAKSGRRTDCWLELGDGTASGSSIIWKPGVNGDRWSPADCANMVSAVFNSALKDVNLTLANGSKYERAVIQMWAHNRGTGIMNRPEYVEMTRALARRAPQMTGVVETVRPDRFIRSDVLMKTVNQIANETTKGDTYPVMALMSYLITECRYAGKW